MSAREASGGPRLEEGARALVLAHRDFAAAQARSLRRRLPACFEDAELLDWALDGLLDAALRFDAGAGARFTTFAFPRVRGAIIDRVRRRIRDRRAERRLAGLEAEADYLERAAGPPPAGASDEELACRFSTAARELAVHWILAGSIGADGLVDAAAPEPDEDPLIAAEWRERVRAARGSLPPRQQRVLELVVDRGLTKTAAADALGVNKATVTRDYDAAVEALALRLGPAAGVT